MEILLNPNIAYLVLVAGFLLAFMAILIPGTGLAEIGALFTLLVAGYEVSQLPINFLALIILLIGVIPFLIAVRKSGNLLYLVLSIAALVLGSVFLFRSERWYQPAVNPLLAVLVSTLTAGFMWITMRKTLEAAARPPVHKLMKVVGETGEAATDIFAEGSVQMDGEQWSARSKALIQAGSEVRVVGRDGFILDVEQVSPPPVNEGHPGPEHTGSA